MCYQALSVSGVIKYQKCFRLKQINMVKHTIVLIKQRKCKKGTLLFIQMTILDCCST